MQNTIEHRVIRMLKERVASGELNGIDVTYRVVGGAPGDQPVNEEFHLSGPGLVHARMMQELQVVQESSLNIAAPELKDVLLEISEGADELIPRSEARFIPDSVVGQISVKVDGQEASFFFLADEEQRKQHGKVLSPKAARLVETLQRLHKRVLQQ
jgi:hypothetical protein